MLALAVELLTGRYVATAYNDRSRAEWPPHPARLFSALVATHFAEPEPAPEERAVLEWLERQGPPHIAASEVAPRDVVTVFVPVNDTTVLDSADQELAAVAQARQDLAAVEMARDDAGAGERKRQERVVDAARKRLAKAESKLESKLQRALAPGELSKGGLLAAPRLLPDRRGRQARTFPSVTPAEPRVAFVWPDASPSAEQRVVLDRLVARVVRLGHSSSLVSVRLLDEPVETNWHPGELGELRLRTVRQGQLQALEALFERHRETEPRVMPAVFQLYTSRIADVPTHVPAPVLGDDWLVLRRTGGPLLPSESAVGVARAVRRILMRYARQPVPEIISGHRPDSSPSETPHLAVVPLPFVGSRHADGHLLGVAIVLPRLVTREERRLVFEALKRWEDDCRQEDEDTPPLPVHLGRTGTLYLMRLEDVVLQTSLRTATWCAPARRWASATPVALDRYPGDLRAPDPARRARAMEEAEETIRRACEHVGLPRPMHVTVQPAPPVAGAASARCFAPFSGGAGRSRRVLAHVVLAFPHEVGGPILLGAGRYLGLGLFRPLVDHG